jgi:hypothetical protein
MSNQPEYLGDGVYATYDGWYVELRLSRHDVPFAVALEPPVMEKLIAYYRRVATGKAQRP